MLYKKRATSKVIGTGNYFLLPAKLSVYITWRFLRTDRRNQHSLILTPRQLRPFRFFI